MFNLVSILGACASVYWLSDKPIYLVAGLGFSVILFIVLGEKSSLEERWEGLGLPGREAFASLAALGICLGLGTFGWDRVADTARSKFEILALILSFAIVSNGLSKSGFFEFAAYKIVEKCAGDTRRLILYLFILSSLLTLFTSNDIVVLTLTPIIYAVCTNARMENGKLLLLSQFVAANTLAMGLMIGSPTNIILSDYFDLDFLGYLVMMVVPAIFAFLLSLVIVDFINTRSRPQAAGLFSFGRLGWHYTDQYRVPARVPWSEFTPSMGRWIAIFAAAVVALMIVTGSNATLLWVAVPLAVGSALLLMYELVADERYRDISIAGRAGVWFRAVAMLPYGIVFFAITFFVFADFVADSPLVRNSARWIADFADNNTLLAGPFAVLGSGVLVNIFNDLPAAALIGEAFQTALATPTQVIEGDHAIGPVARMTLIQGMLVGVNIGCYLTPVGALAGLLWFSQMNAEARRQKETYDERAALGIKLDPYHQIRVPTRTDLVLYGALHFLVTGLLVGLFLPFAAIVLDVFVHPVNTLMQEGLSVGVANGALISIAGLIVVTFILMRARAIVAKNQIALSHMSEIFTVLNNIAIWSFRHPILYLLTLLGIFMSITGGLVYWAELNSMERYGAIAGPSELPFAGALNPATFVSWFFVLFGSGYEQRMFPQSVLGQFIAGIVPLTALAAVLYVVRSTSTDSLDKLRTALGLGKIPNYRILIVNHQSNFEGVVKRLLKRKGAFAVLLCRPQQVERANTFATSLLDNPVFANRVLVKEIDADPYATLRDLDFASASEIFFLSDMTAASDIDNMRMLTRIDAWLNTQRIAAVEEISALTKASRSGHGPTRSFGDFLGVPKILFEASSSRQLNRIESTLSDLLRYQTVLVALDDVVSNQFISDVYGDLSVLNERLGFTHGNCTNPTALRLFEGQRHPFDGFKIGDAMASGESRRLLTNFLRAHLDEEKSQGRSAKTHSSEVRAGFPTIVASARTERDGVLEPIPGANVLGIRSPVARKALRMTLATAVMSAQARDADGWVVLKRGHDDPLPLSDNATSIGDESRRVFLFNYNAYAETLVRSIVFSTDPAIADQTVVIMVTEDINIPNDLASQSNVRIFRRRTVEEAVGVLAPYSPASSNAPPPRRPQGMADIEGVKPGDSVIVFTDYEKEQTSNVEIVQFIESLDYRLSQGRNARTTEQRSIYLGVECNNEETRFLFEHLSVDKIIDTSRLRRSYVEQGVDLYHGTFARMRDPKYAGGLANAQWGQFHPTMFNFRRAFDYAHIFRSFVAEIAESSIVTDSRGLPRSAVGLTTRELHALCQGYSEPPLEFVTVCKVKPCRFSFKTDGEYGAGVTVERMPFDPDYVIERNDLLVFLSSL